MSSIFDPATGTVKQWRVNGIDLLFPETEVEIGGEKKTRGGAFPCAPIFGDQPANEPAFKDVNLPKHGLLRTDISRRFEGCTIENTWNGYRREGCAFEFIDEEVYFPWRVNIVTEMVFYGRERNHFEYTLKVGRIKTDENPQFMPVSMGFHPFFATFGNGYEIRCGDVHHDQFTVLKDDPFFVAREESSNLLDLILGHGTITVTIHGSYTDFCIWTDDRSQYICVEPVMLGDSGEFGSYQLLQPGDWRTGICTMAFTPH